MRSWFVSDKSSDEYHMSYLNRKIEAPWIPAISNSVDISNFNYRDDGILLESKEVSHVSWDKY